MTVLLTRVADSVRFGRQSRFTGMGSVASMGIFEFGNSLTWDDDRPGETKVGSEYAIHASCPFRIIRGKSIVLGSEDFYWRRCESSPESVSQADETMFAARSNLIDQALSRQEIFVVSVDVSIFGDFTVTMGDGLVISGFPAGSRSTESWRFIRRFGDHVTFP